MVQQGKLLVYTHQAVMLPPKPYFRMRSVGTAVSQGNINEHVLEAITSTYTNQVQNPFIRYSCFHRLPKNVSVLDFPLYVQCYISGFSYYLL